MDLKCCLEGKSVLLILSAFSAQVLVCLWYLTVFFTGYWWMEPAVSFLCGFLFLKFKYQSQTFDQIMKSNWFRAFNQCKLMTVFHMASICWEFDQCQEGAEMFTCNILSILEKLLWQELFIVLVLQLRSGICLLSCINPSRCVPHTSAPCSVPGRLTDKNPIRCSSALWLPSGFGSKDPW